jgi:23S rRNA (uridine2552-2'-O)-methyltransferase
MTDEERRRWRGTERTSEARGGGERVRDRNKSASQRAWIARQINDPYVRRAKAEGLRSRAAFKLIELDERFGLIRSGARVLDLGAAPGGWSQVAIERGAAMVVGVDLLPIDPLADATFLQMDFLAPEAYGAIAAALGGAPDLVLSDLAANTTGHQRTDQIRTGALAEAAAEFALAHLAPGGAFVAKAFQGGLDAELLKRLKHAFERVRHAKPPASRTESAEIYLVATGRRGLRARSKEVGK